MTENDPQLDPPTTDPEAAPDSVTEGDEETPQPPADNKGGGRFAVYDTRLMQYVTGVSNDRTTATKAAKGNDHLHVVEV